ADRLPRVGVTAPSTGQSASTPGIQPRPQSTEDVRVGRDHEGGEGERRGALEHRAVARRAHAVRGELVLVVHGGAGGDGEAGGAGTSWLTLPKSVEPPSSSPAGSGVYGRPITSHAAPNAATRPGCGSTGWYALPSVRTATVVPVAVAAPSRQARTRVRRSAR